ncbi:hypothetical protein GCM10009839_41410 [Catenulispora yoronensis]|uniref:FXSXX-COOH protein n=1 Tax=Catenulispora yoronensis TaxID=450799 RepID=A0ABN2UF44_9ACTN
MAHTEPVGGMPDLSDLALDALADAGNPALRAAVAATLRRREGSGIVYAGFNAGLTAVDVPFGPDSGDDPDH